MGSQGSRPGALIAVDKPSQMTSHDVVARVRRALGLRRVGHAGTLDPAATGVLIIGLGQATRLLGFVTLADKSYVAEFVFGAETSTDDAEGDVVRTAEVPEALRSGDALRRAIASLKGESLQVPPAVSAVSKGGRRAYAAARKGEALELDPRPIEVYDATLLSEEVRDGFLVATVALRVSKGCYVRALARDLGRELGCLGHVGSLKRTASGPVTLGRCLSLEDLETHGWDIVASRTLDPLLLAGLSRRDIEGADVVRARNGQPLYAHPGEGPLVGICWDGLLRGVWELRAGELRPKANLVDGVLLGGA